MNMILKHLSVLNFKNYEEASLEFSSDVNCLVGDNGSGKTNVLDAIHYLGLCKSYYNPIDSQNIKFDEPFFVVEGEIVKNGQQDKLYCGVKRGQKKMFKRNQKEYDRLADHIGRYPVVMITPNDIDLIREGSEVRRKFMDSIIAQYDARYLDDLIAYNKALSQRNNLLKYFSVNRTFDLESLEIWDEQLVNYGSRIFASRTDFINKFVPEFKHYYAEISGGMELVGLSYNSGLLSNDFRQMLKESRDKDRRFQRTTCGIHKDDLEFLISEHPVKKYGSQGQQKSFLIALKLGQFQFLKKAKEVTPLLLLDDVFDKIDDKRVSYLMNLVSRHEFGQIFITDTHGDRVPDLFRKIDSDVRIFNVSSGNIASLISEEHEQEEK